MTINKIGNRVFMYVFFPLMMMITIIFFSQFTYLDDWYYNRKTQALIKNIDAAAMEIEKININDYDYENKLYPFIKEFEERNSATLNFYIYGVEEEKLEGDYEVAAKNNALRILTIETVNHNVYYMYLDNQEWDISEIESYIKNGMGFEVEGYAEGDFFYPIKIANVEAKLNSAALKYDDKAFDQLELYSGDVQVVDVDISNFLKFGYSDDFFQDDEFEQIHHGLKYAKSSKGFTGVQIMTFQKIVLIDGGKVGYLYVEASLQGISEMMAFTIPFFAAFYIVGLAVSIGVSRLLSQYLTKPILEMKDITAKMSELDFNERIENISDDELGDLAISINVMSDKLESSMKDLNEVNRVLLEEIENEREIERQRKAFIANVSHDLKTPLGIAKSYLEAILDGIRKENHNEYIKITINEIDRMNQIVLNMLELMKFESTQREIVYSKERILPYFEEIRQYFNVHLEKKRMSIILPTAMEAAYVENRTFKTLIINMMSNAINYGKEDSSIQVKCLVRKDKQYIVVENEVEHPDEIDLDKIWHKFYTADQSRNRMSSGTGLGLSIIKTILEQYDSDYDVDVKGNKFVFEFSLRL